MDYDEIIQPRVSQTQRGIKMSALTPENKKYRKSWTIFGQQLGNKEMLKTFREKFDDIKWGDPKRFKEKETNLPGYTKIKYKS